MEISLFFGLGLLFALLAVLGFILGPYANVLNYPWGEFGLRFWGSSFMFGIGIIGSIFSFGYYFFSSKTFI